MPLLPAGLGRPVGEDGPFGPLRFVSREATIVASFDYARGRGHEMRKSLRLLFGGLVLLPVITVMFAAGRAADANANATVEVTGAMVKIIGSQTSLPGFDYSTTPPSTRYRWVRIWLRAFNFTRQTLTLQCKLDKAAWAPCGKYPGSGNSTRTFKGLAPGVHTIRVRLVDPAGNVPPPVSVYPYGTASIQEAPSVFTWRITSIADPPPPATFSATPLVFSLDSRGSVVGSPGWPLPRTLKAGVYDFLLKDRSIVHNIHVVGVGIDRRTSVAGTTVNAAGAVTLAGSWVNVRLRPGELTLYSDTAPTRRISITIVS